MFCRRDEIECDFTELGGGPLRPTAAGTATTEENVHSDSGRNSLQQFLPAQRQFPRDRGNIFRILQSCRDSDWSDPQDK